MASGPDAGFAWVIALACFVINFIMAGLARTVGVLYVAIIDLYGVSRETATTPFSIRVCVRNMTGPLVGLLGQKYGIRGITTIGGLVAAVGSILCYFAPNVLWITIFWGVVHGFGFGLSTVLHMITVNQYFDKYKATALGLGYSGDCFGTFAFPVIIEKLISHYGVRGTFLIIGGIILNAVPMALLLRKPPWLEDRHKSAKLRKNVSEKHLTLKNHTDSLSIGRTKALKTRIELSTVSENDRLDKSEFKTGENPAETNIPTFRCKLKGQYNKAFELSESDLNALNMKIANKDSGHESGNSDDSLEVLNPHCQTHLITDANKVFQCYDTLPINANGINSPKNERNDLQAPTEIKTSRSASDLRRRNEFICNMNRSLRLENKHTGNLRERNELPPLFEGEKSIRDVESVSEDHERKEAVIENESPRVDGNGTLKNRTSSFVGQVAQELVNRMRTASFASQVAQDAFVAPIGQEEESEPEKVVECELKCIVEHKDHDAENCTHQDLILSINKSMKDDYFRETKITEDKTEEKPKTTNVINLLIRTNTRPMFILISMSMAVYAFLFVGIITIIIDYASDNGVSQEKAKYLIIGFSVADLVGRLSFGQVIDRKLMKMKNYSGSTMVLMGVLSAVIPLNTSFNYMMVCMCMYGLAQGGIAIIFPILVNTYMDKSTESVAMGCLNFYGGLLMLLMAPMIGYFRDNTGSYNYVFYIMGGVVAVVGVIWQFEPMIVKFQNRKLREKYIMKEINALSLQK